MRIDVWKNFAQFGIGCFYLIVKGRHQTLLVGGHAEYTKNIVQLIEKGNIKGWPPFRKIEIHIVPQFGVAIDKEHFLLQLNGAGIYFR